MSVDTSLPINLEEHVLNIANILCAQVPSNHIDVGGVPHKRYLCISFSQDELRDLDKPKTISMAIFAAYIAYFKARVYTTDIIGPKSDGKPTFVLGKYVDASTLTFDELIDRHYIEIEHILDKITDKIAGFMILLHPSMFKVGTTGTGDVTTLDNYHKSLREFKASLSTELASHIVVEWSALKNIVTRHINTLVPFTLIACHIVKCGPHNLNVQNHFGNDTTFTECFGDDNV